ncbi:alpha-N-acetylgalactosaminidase-like [Arctopsyche grandis]|uniref:alpha-N-acetylgalactosaminidase-like n=1 Tax=Arctopsyche grandis TaxID=121162 RepID=UPI00406D89B6
MNHIFFLLLLSLNSSLALDNGLGLTPPMGWLSWQRYRCTIDCVNHPQECISENLITRQANLMKTEGYLDAGYNYVGIDDCWSESQRDENQRLVPSKERFPRGMKYIADFIQERGLKFGLYGDFGTHTCEGYPGSLNYMEIDATTFAEWGVDYVKVDGCNVDASLMDEGYPKFGEYFNKTGRPMMYSCSWPFYLDLAGISPNWESIIENCNIWRNYYDIQDSWGSVESIMNYFGDNSKRLATYAGPGHWNDPDMLVIGNFGLSYDQSKAQMAVWSILAAPLLMSNDLGNIKLEMKELLLNKDVIAINQDSLGRAGYRPLKKSQISAWKREVSPIISNRTSLAVAFVNHNDNGTPRFGNFTFEELEIDTSEPFNGYEIQDLLPSSTQKYTVYQTDGRYRFEVLVNPTGVLMLKLTAK